MATIVVIEDEDAIRNELIEWMGFEGHQAIGAANGRLGLEAVLKHIPDVIICDIKMPEMDGYHVLFEVRSNPDLNHIPFIFLTAIDSRELMRAGMDLGADDYLTKPFTHAEVVNSIQARLQKQTSQQQHLQAQMQAVDNVAKEERQKRALKSRLVAMFSHDFRTSLSIILSSASLMRDYGDRLEPANKRMKVEQIITSGQQLLQMVDDMLFVAEMENDQFDYSPEPLKITAFLSGIVEQFRALHANTHTLQFESVFQDSLEADPKLLRHIITNLISNAVKYSPNGGEVLITLTVDERQIELSVEDHGIGIPDDYRDSLFKPFQRASNARDQQGTGLGLAIVKEAVDLCGGSIEVRSALGQGSIFTVQLPRDKSEMFHD